MFLGKTKDTWKKELIQLLFFCFWATCLVAVITILTFGVSFATGKGLREAYDIIAKIAGLAAIAYNLILLLLDMRRRCASLLDMGRSPHTKGVSYFVMFYVFLAIVTIPTLPILLLSAFFSPCIY